MGRWAPVPLGALRLRRHRADSWAHDVVVVPSLSLSASHPPALDSAALLGHQRAVGDPPTASSVEEVTSRRPQTESGWLVPLAPGRAPLPITAHGRHRVAPSGPTAPDRPLGALLTAYASAADWERAGLTPTGPAFWIGLDSLRAQERHDRTAIGSDINPLTAPLVDARGVDWNAPRVWRTDPPPSAALVGARPAPISLLIASPAWSAALARADRCSSCPAPWPNDPDTGLSLIGAIARHLTACAAALEWEFPAPTAATLGARWRRWRAHRAAAAVRRLARSNHADWKGGTIGWRVTARMHREACHIEERAAVEARLRHLMTLAALLLDEGAPLPAEAATEFQTAQIRLDGVLDRWRRLWSRTELPAHHPPPLALPEALRARCERAVLAGAASPQRASENVSGRRKM